MEDKQQPKLEKDSPQQTFRDIFEAPFSGSLFGYVPNYPKPIDINPFNLVEGNENKRY